MSIPVLPVMNGAIPRESREITGVFLDKRSRQIFRSGRGSLVLLLPYDHFSGLYPVGTLVSVQDLWQQPVITSPSFKVTEALFVRVSGKATVKAGGFELANGRVYAREIERLDLRRLRKSYPVIDGAGWSPTEGNTEVRNPLDIRVTVFGVSHEGEEVSVSANLGGLVSGEIAHTIEHAIIRALQRYAMVTPKTLRECMKEETDALKASLSVGYSLKMPELFGVTDSGMCGNPLTGLAHFYLAHELKRNLESGASFARSLEEARLSTLSKVTGDLDLTTQRGARVMQGLKMGMMHDDSPQESETLKLVLSRFPLSPWD
ncbi:MAG TPA: hypothetical protein GX512_07465 [Firmicutes bacterium]|nr:hypothetical protein [Candidatus Fermentithermobacillaceae bacterium]